MESIKLICLCLLVLLPLTLLKKYATEQAVLLALAVAVLVVLRCVAIITPVLDTLKNLFTRAGIENAYISVLFRTVGASLVTRICADLCRDAGSQTLATLVESAGTLAVLLISLPIVEAVAELLLGYFG